ncbi:segregation/condensation protein A [Corynebacterium qintianiae]|uniref:Segregation and condensation protein A n=1 Tax=Corynebacterium qintianiae TaxID=2709392 RepID=A0A7T0PGV7_9CORY|nr:segregation/condensation protein A [Corynebacterium qintianiae]QPK84287.1 segregation/condensation protein A [Corynebacterium qintianiae]
MEQPEITGFTLVLNNFEGPFDLLLTLISSKKLDVTEVALSEVTDEFIAYTRALGQSAGLDEVTEFILIAARLLDLKASRLLPRGEASDDESLELLESRDLLFARLLQYRAYQRVADQFSRWEKNAARRYPRAVAMEAQFADLLPPVTLGHTPASFAVLAASVFRPRPPEEVRTDHVHTQAVSVPEQAGKILSALQLIGADHWVTFGALTRDCTRSIEVVGRFLALLELFKARAVEARQDEALGPLDVSWTGREVDPAVVAAGNWT